MNPNQLEETSTTGWVVMDSQKRKYRKMDACGIGWTYMPESAPRFFRRIDAECFAAGDEDAWFIVPGPPL